MSEVPPYHNDTGSVPHAQERGACDESQASLRLRLLGRLAGVVSHEIYNPLNVVSLHADILEEELRRPGGGNSEQLRNSLAMVRSGVTRLHDLMQDYLALARLALLSREPEVFGAILETIDLEMQEALGIRGITLHIAQETELGQVALDRRVFLRAMRSLIQALADALPREATLTIRGQRLETHICLEITACGASLPREQLELLCGPVQLSGLDDVRVGLLLVHESIVAHAGEIALVDVSEQRTTLTVTLPLLPPVSIPRASRAV